jgi:hypothetical protein
VESLLLAVNGWLDAAGLVDWARGNAWAYPIANVLHVLGAVMLVGGIGVVDLRIVGLWRRLPLVPLSEALTPIAIAGAVLQVASGAVLFAADGTALSASTTFQVKLVLFALALGNAALFRLHWRRAAKNDLYAPPGLLRASALLSLSLWLSIAVAGRLIAYL